MTFGFGTLIDRAWLLVDEGATRVGSALSSPVRTAGQTPTLDVLEDRVLFSATPMGAVADLVDVDGTGVQSSQVAHLLESEAAEVSDGAAASDATRASNANQIVFIDSAVADLDALTADLNRDDSRFAVFILDAQRDGVDQISEILAGQQDVQGIHIVSHGEEGQIKLGNTWLGIDEMDGYAGQIANWGGSLADGADLLIYGCDIASTSDGRAMIDALGALCACDVAASDDDTGNGAYDADWLLEYTTGSVQTEVAFSESLQSDWMGKLAVITVDTTADVVDAGDGLTSLREAIIATNGGSGGDTIQLGAGTYTLTLAGNDNNALRGDLDITQSVTILGAAADQTIIDGGGIDRVFHTRGNTTVATISGVTIQGGANDNYGGGIFVDQESTLNLIDSVVQGNDGGNDRGGGVHVHGTLNATGVLFTNNTAEDGGAIYYHGANGGTLTNVTISGNIALHEGGGIWTDTDITIISSTITLNDANDGGGVYSDGDEVTLSNTIIAGNKSFTGLKDVAGDFNSDGSNMIQVVGSATGLGGDLTGVDPQLAGLADNGGATLSHMPVAGSAAINAGTATGPSTVDQRGIARDASPDIGAIERVTPSIAATATSRVNTTTSNTQETAGHDRGSLNSIAIADNGNYVVVWSSDNQDGSGWGVYGAIYAADGTVLKNEFQLNNQTANDQIAVSVASDSAGNFVATWTSTNQDGDDNGVYAQRFDAAGNKLGGEIQVNATTVGPQQSAVVAVDRATGDFAIVWEQNNLFSRSVFAQTFDADGTKTGPTENNIATINDILVFHTGPTNPHISMLNGGGYVVGWQAFSDIRVQKFDAFGNTVGSELKPEDSALTMAGESDLAVHHDGSMVVVWTESGTTIKMLRYDSAGNVIGAATTVNTTQAGEQSSPVVDMADDGSYIVAWQGNGDRTGAIDNSGVFAQKYNADGTTNGDEFRINTSTAGDQNQVSLAVVGPDQFVAVWSGAGPGDTTGVFVRQFNPFHNTAPIAVTGGPYTINEGDALTIDGTGSTDADTDPLQFEWDLDNDGSFGETAVLRTSTATLPWSVLQGVGIDNDGVYTIGLRVSDGKGGVDTSTTTLTVLNVAPSVTSNAIVTIDENSTIAQTVTATDPADTIVYSIIGGPDESRFTIDANTGVLSFVAAPDFENPTDSDGDNGYSVQVAATDTGGASDVIAILVTVADTNDNAPVIASVPLATVSESSGVGTLVANLSASDADTAATFGNWTITDGNLDGIFAIDAASGQITIADATNLDFEATTGYALSVTVSDGVNTSVVQSVSIAIADENDNAPVIAAGAEFTLSEIEPSGTLLGTLNASDVDASPSVLQNWTIVGGNTLDAFQLDATTGELSLRDQTVLDATTTPLYTLQITVSDDVNVSAIETVTVNVTPTLAPVAGDDNFTVAEGGTINVSVDSDWHNASWHQRQLLTLDNSASGSALTDFAVLVKLHGTATDAITIDYSRTQDQGQDLRFIDSDGTLLTHEIQSWDESGYSYVWVRVPTIDAASNSDSIWMYYDNPGAMPLSAPSATWTTDNVAVLHLDGDLQDSSTADNDGAGTAGSSTAGQVGSAASFNGTNSTVSLGSDTSLDNIFENGGSISGWINAEDWGGGNFGRIVDKASSLFNGGSTGGAGWALEVGNQGTADGFLLFNVGFSGGEADWRTPVGSIQLNTWHHVALVYDSNFSSNDPQIYVDGVLQTVTEMRTPSGSVLSDAAIDMTVGNFAQATSRAFDGLIDELRITDTARTAAQINAERLQGLGLFVSGGPVESGPGGVLQNDYDPEGQTLQVALLDAPLHAATFHLAADGSFTYVHGGGEVASDSFTYTLTDLSGVSSVGTVHLTVTPVNDAPTAHAGGTYTIEEGSSLSLDGSLSSDVDNAIVSYRWDLDGDGIFGEPGESLGELAIADWATLNTHGITGDGSYTIGLQVTDALGLTATSTATLIVTNVAPTAFPDGGFGFITDEGTSFITGNVFDNDIDPNEFDTLSFVSVDATGILGTLVNLGDGTFSYDPNGQFESLALGEQAVETFTYTISDGSDGLSTAVVSIVVRGTNDAPTIQIGTETLSYIENQGPVAPLANITLHDVDGSTLQSARIWFGSGYAANQDNLEFTNVGNIHGHWDKASATLTLIGTDTRANYEAAIRSVMYRNPSETPSETPRVLQVEINDGNLLSATVARSVRVTSVNDNPVAGGDSFDVVGGETLTGSGLLQNDTDVDGDPLTAQLVSGPSNGTLTLSPDGSFVYHPDVEFAGIDRFTYVAFDGQAASEPQEVVIVIAAANLSGGTGSVGDSGSSSNDSSSSNSLTDNLDDSKLTIVESAIAAGSANTNSANESVTPRRVETAAIEILEDLAKTDEDDAAILGVMLGDDEQFNWAPQLQRQAITLERDVEKTAANDSQATRNDDGNIIAQYDFIAQPGMAWEEMDAFRSQIDGQLFGNAITFTTVGITSSSFALGYITWVMRSGFVLTGLLANMPVWRSFDPLVVISGMSHEGNAETLQEIISREKQNLDQSTKN
ncbi:Cadherin domain protein [Rosistilla ulvae]|uniref:Cadherin domain protein n=1 Tax=Rosistilla ulvae TaxID=1930277 RepID=A0A517M0G7_9BACT|nr:DUF2341 domain-containing protein [Rosistilla ulvae]QDS88367.1 Cadherin domain protein [Rosistilla ulvae]